MSDSAYFVSLSNGLRSALNVALGISPTDLVPINANLIVERLKQIDTGEVGVPPGNNGMNIFTQMMLVEFSIKFSHSPSWGVIYSYDLEALRAYGHVYHVTQKAQSPKESVDELLDIFKRIKLKDAGYGQVLNIIKNAMVYGILANCSQVTAEGAFTLMAALHAEEA